VKRIALRDEEAPNDAVVVVRGGQMNGDHVRRSATDAYNEFGLYSVSVFLALDASVAELCRDLEELQRYSKVRPAAITRLRSHSHV